MAKKTNLIPEELDALIQEYLTDGVLTSKEREVILKKAEKMGIDRDEIDLYLDAQVQKIDQASDAAVRKQKGKACPFCGAPVPQLADKCPECGQFITPEANKELQDILDNLEESLIDLKSGQNFERSKATVERYARKASLYYSNNPKIEKLLSKIEDEMGEAEKRAKSKAKQQGLVNIISNKWVWCLLELIFVFLLYSHFDSKQSEAYQIYQEAEGRARTAEWNDVESAQDNKTLVIFAGIAIIGGTVYLATKDSKRK